MYNRKIPSLPRSSQSEKEKHIVPLVAAAIIAGGSAIIQSGVNYATQHKANKTNKKLTRETNDLNYQMFKEQMEYEKEQADLEFERNKEQQAYATQVGLMRQAGLNPAVMYGQGSVSQPAQYQRASSVSRPDMEAAQVQPEIFDFTTPVQQAVTAAAQFENDISQAPVNVGVKRSNILANNSSAQEMQVRARAEQFQLDMDKLFSGMERTAELNKAINDFKNSVADWQNKLLQGKNIKADTIDKLAGVFLKHMQTQLTEMQYDSLKQQLPQILANLKATGENIKAETYSTIKNADTNAAVGASQIEANKASAAASREQVQLTKAQKKVQESIEELNRIDIRNKKAWHYKLRLFNENLNAAMRENIYTEQQKQEFGIIRERLKMAIKTNDMYLFTLLTGQLSSVMGSAANVAKAVK